MTVRRSGIPRLFVVALAASLAACSGPTASSAPTASPASAPSSSPVVVAPTELPSALPSSTPLPTSTLAPSPTASTYTFFPELSFVDYFVVRVAVDDLNVRRKPDKSGISNGKADKGTLFTVAEWPISANGYTWYYGYVQLESNNVVPKLPLPYNDGYDDVLSGWMAAGTEDTPFFVPVGPRCPSTRDWVNISAMLPSERVACFGSDTITLEGAFSNDGCGGEAPGTFEPSWLAHPLECARIEPTLEDAQGLYLHFAPDGPALPAEGAIVRVSAHYSDPRSVDCRISVLNDDGTGNVKVANSAAEVWCRTRLVIDSYEVIG